MDQELNLLISNVTQTLYYKSHKFFPVDMRTFI